MPDQTTVEVSLFGALDVRINGNSTHLGVSGTTRSLLQYLFCSHDRLIRREQLMEIFWPDTRMERRRSSLNSAIWRLRKALADAPLLFIDATADCVQLVGGRKPGVMVDFIRLEQSLRSVDREVEGTGLGDLVDALSFCDGTPLDGLDEDWAVIERERLALLRMRGLSVAMRLLASAKHYDEALELGRRILLLEPYRECAFQEVLCLYVLNGQRARALRLFDDFAAALKADLGIEPMEETRALRDFLASDRGQVSSKLVNLPAADAGSPWSPGVGPLVSHIAHSRNALRTRG